VARWRHLDEVVLRFRWRRRDAPPKGAPLSKRGADLVRSFDVVECNIWNTRIGKRL
jgi:hypothetical protein